MNPLAWLNPGRWALYVLFAGVLWLGYNTWAGHQQDIGRQEAEQRYEKALDKQKAEARLKLAAETQRAHDAEQALRNFKDTQELKDAQAKKTIAGLSARLRDLAGPDGRLRDPNGTGCRCGGGGAAGTNSAGTHDREADGADAGGLLSTQLSGLLQRLQREADEVNAAYASCRADAFEVRRVLGEQQP